MFRFWGNPTSPMSALPTLPTSTPNYFPPGFSFVSPPPGSPRRCVRVNPVSAEGPPADHLPPWVGLPPCVLGLCEIRNYICSSLYCSNHQAQSWINTSLKTHQNDTLNNMTAIMIGFLTEFISGKYLYFNPQRHKSSFNQQIIKSNVLTITMW